MHYSAGKYVQKCRWYVVAIWLLATIISAIFLLLANKPFKIGGISDPNVESSLATKTMTEVLPHGGGKVFVLYKSEKLYANDPEFSEQVKKSLDGLRHLAQPHRVISPYQNDKQIADNNHLAYAAIIFDMSAEEASNYINQIHAALGKPKSIEMIVGGEPSYINDIQRISQSNLVRAESIAFPLSIIVLIYIFGNIVAALLPILTAALSITMIIAMLYIIGVHTELSIFVLNIATMLGLGLTLDYAILIINRFKEELHQRKSVKEAISITYATAGKAVFYSGLAVMISFSALLVFPVNILYSIGVGGIIVVISSLLGALFFLPAMLCILGKRIDAVPVRYIQTTHSERNVRQTWLYRMAMTIMRHPIFVLIPTMLFLIFLGTPFIHAKLNRPDSSALPSWVESRRLLDEFKANFNPNEITPISILLRANNESILTKQNIAHLYDFAKHLKKDERVDKIASIVSFKSDMTKLQYEQLYAASVKPFNSFQNQYFHDSTSGRYTVMTVISKYPENDQNSFDLVKAIRDRHIGNKITKEVTGGAAVIIDTIHSIYPLFFKTLLTISLITYVILLLLFRSLILPLKAIIMSYFSLLVSYGMMVFIFQEGHFASILNFTAQGFTDLNLPILLFFGIFGLSMDYEVFLLARIKEYYERTHDNNQSVALGLERSARIITSAALIMVIVMLAFVSSDIIFVKAFGLGNALAIIVDATVVRIFMVPATMRLLGDWNWYLPKWLDRLLPNIRFNH